MQEMRKFLEFSINYQENRISLLDSKANILIAIQLGIFGVLAFIMDKIIISNQCLTWQVLVFGAVLLIFVASIIFLALHTIRPTDPVFSTKSGVTQAKSEGILWPKEESPTEYEKLHSTVEALNDNKILIEYDSTIFVLHQRLRKKLKYYRTAILIAKYEVAVLFFGFSCYLLYSIFN